MSIMRKALTTAGVVALTTFGVAACGGDTDTGGTGGGTGGGEINVSMTSFPD
jgi:peptide/nickel transport system substrate-binding protein